MSALSWFFFLSGSCLGFVIRLLVESYFEDNARKKGHSWPVVRDYEQNAKMYNKNGFHGVAVLSDGDTWDNIADIECHLINQSKYDDVISSGAKVL